MSRKQILIVEDDPEWRDILHELLEKSVEELVIFTAATHNEALKQLRQRQFALVTMDIKLVGSGLAKAGLDVVNHIAIFCKSTKIIVVSAVDLNPTEVRKLFKKYKIVDFFVKDDFDREEFIKMVKEAIEGSADGPRQSPSRPRQRSQVKEAIDESSADGPEDERAALQGELVQRRSNLYKLRKQAAMYAAGETPMRLLNQIEAEKKEIRRIKVMLKNLGG